jgi:hypothetical protein
MGVSAKEQATVHCKRQQENLLVTNEVSADKPLAPPGRKQATATEDFDFRISYL